MLTDLIFENIQVDFDELLDNTRIRCTNCHLPTNLSHSTTKTFAFYTCLYCEYTYGVCYNCNCCNENTKNVRLSKLIEHHNYYDVPKNSNENYRIINSNKDETIVRYKIPSYFFNEKIFGEITGPDGGFSSTWYCKCGLRTVTDK